MAKLILIRGPPGSGKSTISSLVARNAKNTIVISLDAFIYGVDWGNIKKNKHLERDRFIQPIIVDLLRKRKNVIVDAVQGGPKTMDKLFFYKRIARETKVKFHLINLVASKNITVKRVKVRENHPANLTMKEARYFYDFHFKVKIKEGLFIDTEYLNKFKCVRQVIDYCNLIPQFPIKIRKIYKYQK